MPRLPCRWAAAQQLLATAQRAVAGALRPSRPGEVYAYGSLYKGAGPRAGGAGVAQPYDVDERGFDGARGMLASVEPRVPML